MSDEFKAKGNAAFKAQNFKEAIEHFTAGIEVDPKNHVLYSNRSACHASLNDYKTALEDAEKCIQAKSDWAKGYGRKGAALFGMGKYVEAAEAYDQGLSHDANSAMLKQGKADCEAKIRATGQNSGLAQLAAMFAAPGAMQKLASNPKTAAYLADPTFRRSLEALQTNPSSAMMDQRLIECLGVLMGQDFGSAPDAEASAGNVADDSDDDDDEIPDLEPSAPKSQPAKKAPEPKKTPEPEPEPEVDPEVAARQKQAAEEKALGTKAYKAKDFETAIKHYSKAAEVDPTDLTFHLNLGAVYLEQKEYEKCIAACHKAVEVGQENRADYKKIAKAYARIGKAYYVQSAFKDAITWYDKAITNDRAADYLNMKKKANKALKEAERAAYIDPEKSLEAKERGNAHFKAGKWPDAIKEYSEAIARNPEDGKLYSNRAAAYSKLMEFNLALKDCEECIKLAPDFIKGYLRKGNILLGMKKFAEAKKAFLAAQEIDPSHPEAAEGLRKAEFDQMGLGLSDEERAKQALNDPEVRELMSDPVMQTILEQMSKDPKAAQEHLKNPDIAKKIQKLAQAGIIRFG
eukprot:TRINITY_DN12259_c0_g3_i3.p2 TRINITY_DN12259_c0_g3~~TRINITY_DN12259_c0_g3_i3.p2  ORF type:complete len:574 (+),score=186.45 TRINITY_DN12259_c0_g3_i3:1876-3597(+)